MTKRESGIATLQVGAGCRCMALAALFVFNFSNDHTNLLYKCGERATFSVKVTEQDGSAPTNGVLSARLDNFGPKKLAEEKWNLAETNVFTIAGTLDEPDFLRLTVDGKVWSVGFEPEKIKKGSPSPDDFDSFWKAAREKLAKEVPLDVRMERVDERSTDAYDFYQVSFATFGRRVYGLLSVPKDKSKGPYPVDFGVNAAGFGGWTNDLNVQPDAICAQFSVYDWPMDWKWKEKGLKKKYDEMTADYAKKYSCGGYSTAGIAVSREEYFFYPVLLGLDRAVDWLASRSDVDPRRFRYQGTSQGGGFGFYLCGLNHHFTRAAFYVPAITDTMGYLQGRQSGWPRIVEQNSKSESQKDEAERNAPYFDGANFASRIQCPVRVAVGFADTTCAPCAVYAAYNEILVADKGIRHGFGMTHSCFSNFYKELGNWVRSDR